MSAKDSQFIERALVHPWMFWAFFWKWPRILRQVCGEYDLVAKDRDAAKAAHEQAVAANEKVRKWIHVTHQLDATADLRAIWTAGKRLSILLVFFVVTNAFGQAPPYLRNQWTTNANPLALKVISTNGVHVATNIWEVDFTNTATVTVSAVSNANKVVVSFTGSSSLTNAVTYDPVTFNVSPTNLNAFRASNVTVVGNLNVRTNAHFEGLTNTHWMRYTNGSLLLNQRRDETFYGQGDVNEFLTYFGAPWEQFKWFVAQDSNLTPDNRSDIEGYWYSFSSTNSNKAFISWFTDMRTIDNELASARFNLQSRSTGTNGLGVAEVIIRTDVVPEDASLSQAILSLDSSLAGKQVQLQFQATPVDTIGGAVIAGSLIGSTNTGWISFVDASSRRFVLSNNFDLVTPGKIIGRDVLGTNHWQISTNGQIKMGKFVDTLFVPGNELGIYDIRSKESESFFTEWVAGIWEKNDGSGGRSTFKVDADLNDTNANFVNLELLARRGGVNRTLSVRNAWGNSEVSLEGTFSLVLTAGDVQGGVILYSNNVSAKTFSVESNGTTRVMGEVGIYPFRNGVVFLPTPTARLQISNAPNFAIPLFRAQTNASNGVLIESNGLLVAMSGFQLTSGTPGAGKVLTDVAGDGVGTWETASSGSGIASIFTNNVLAGGPGLTELEFTNTATVTWAATTNAGRVTMSATSSGGSQTPWLSDIDAAAFSLTNFGTQLAFTNGTILLQTKANEIGLTNGNLKLPTNAFGRILFGNGITNAAISYQTAASGTDGEGLAFYIGANPRFWIDPSGHWHKPSGRFIFGGSSGAPTLTDDSGNWVTGGGIMPSAATTYYLGNSTTPFKGVHESSSFRGRFATNASWTISTNFYVHAWTAIAVVGTVTLPSASTCSNLHIVIKDEGGNASATNLTIAVQSGDRVDGATTALLNVNYSAKNVYSAGGTNWFLY